jgi:cell division transport system ATP-binding protein
MGESTNSTINQPIVHLENLAISHENGMLLTGVNLDLDEGEFVYLIGKSGAGKTSLLRSLYADRPIDNGIAKVCGFDVVNIKRRHIPQLRRRIGIVFQNFRLLDDRNVYANLEFVLRATGWKKKNEIRNQIEKTLTAVGIADKAFVNPMHLSEGEQQRVGIARALINNPALILADEPTGNLDPVTSAEIMQLLLDINQQTKTTMLISTHDFMMIDKFPARVVVCENGTLVDTEGNHQE